jgi:hypothetical protein
VTDRRIPTNLLRDNLKLPRRVEKFHKYLTHDQVRSLAQQAKHPEIVFLLAYTASCGASWLACRYATLTYCAVASALRITA